MDAKERDYLLQRLMRLRAEQYGTNANPDKWQELEDECLVILDYLKIKTSDDIRIPVRA